MKQTVAQPKPGDLLMVYEPSLYEDAIAFAERVSMVRQNIRPPRGRPIYGHVAVYIGHGLVLEALGRGLTRSLASKYAHTADIWTRDVSHNARDAVSQRAVAMFRTGYRYSWWLIAILAVRLLFGLKLPWRQRHRLICSTYAFDCWLADRVRIAPSRACSPEDIALHGKMYFAGEYTGGTLK